MTPQAPNMLDLLAAPLNKSHVKTRTQAGREFFYIEGWHAIAEANRIFGFFGWSREIVECRCVAETPRKVGRDKKDGFSVTYIIQCRIHAYYQEHSWRVERSGTGTGHGIDVDLGLAHESAIKEAETDAMKRALMTFGNQFGLALYDKEQKSVVDDINIPPTQDIIEDYILHITATTSVEELKQFWEQTRDEREDLGIIKGTKEYDFIWAAFIMHGKKLKENNDGN